MVTCNTEVLVVLLYEGVNSCSAEDLFNTTDGKYDGPGQVLSSSEELNSVMIS